MRLPIEYSFKNFMVRRTSVLLTAGGIALLVVIFVVVMGLANGLRQLFASTGAADNLIFVREGASSPLMSSLTEASLQRVRHLPEVVVDARGEPLVSGVVQMSFRIAAGAGGDRVQVTVRGVDPPAFDIGKDVRLVEGRIPAPSSYEVALGVGLAQRLAGGAIGSELAFGGERWTIVGLLESGGSAFESEIWADRQALMLARSRTEYNYIIARIDVPDLESALAVEKKYEDDAGFGMRIVNEARWFNGRARSSGPIRLVCYLLVGVMGVAMVFSCMNTMYGMISARSREIGILRVLGFDPRDVQLGLLIEALAIALAGGLVGVALGFMVNGLPFFYLGRQARFEIGPDLLLSGLAVAAVLGLLGGLLPARRGSRLEIVDVLRSL